jgi:hypothetical protein
MGNQVTGLLILLAGLLGAGGCGHAAGGSGTGRPASDSFELVLRHRLVVPPGISFDTTRMTTNFDSSYRTTVTPRFRDEAMDDDNLRISSALIDKIGQVEPADGSPLHKWEMKVEPVHIHIGGRIASFALKTEFSAPGQMRPLTGYITINYDLQAHKVLGLKDYFKVASTADSLQLAHIMYSAVGEAAGHRQNGYGFDDTFDFAVDADKVYFYFDQGTLAGNPSGLAGSVKKQYCTKIIHDAYR